MKKFLILACFLFSWMYASAIETGVYVIRSACNWDFVIDNNGSNCSNGNNIHIWRYNGTYAQKWVVATMGGKSMIMSLNSPRENHYMLDLNGSNAYNGNNIHLWAENFTPAQMWYIEPVGGGYYVIRSSVNRNFVVDLYGSNATDGNNINIWEWNGTNAQKWYFQKLD